MVEVVSMTEAEWEIWSDVTKRRTNYIYIYIHSRLPTISFFSARQFDDFRQLAQQAY